MRIKLLGSSLKTSASSSVPNELVSADLPSICQFSPNVVVMPFCVSVPERKFPFEESKTNIHSLDQPVPSLSKPVSVLVPFPLSVSNRREVHVPSENVSPIQFQSESTNVAPVVAPLS